MRDLFSAKRGEPLTREAIHGPVGVGPGSQPLIELDRLAVPVEDRPLEPAAISLQRDACELAEQRAPNSVAAPLGNHKEGLEVETGVSGEGLGRVKEEGNSVLVTCVFCYQGLRVTVLAE